MVSLRTSRAWDGAGHSTTVETGHSYTAGVNTRVGKRGDHLHRSDLAVGAVSGQHSTGTSECDSSPSAWIIQHLAAEFVIFSAFVIHEKESTHRSDAF
jgi:hypothetical protein